MTSRTKDLLFWIVPLALAGVAAFFAYRAIRSDEPPGMDDPPEVRVSPMCPAGVFRCENGAIAATTGEESSGDEVPCALRAVGRCAERCVAEGIPLIGVSDETAKTQLCDPPADVEPLVANELGIAQLLAADAASDAGDVCIADGFGPSADGVLQCILKSAKDPDALGIVVGRITCRAGSVATRDDTPRIVSREQAIALWCRRDAAALADAGPLAVDAASDAGSDADADTKPADADAKTDTPTD